MVRSLLVPFIGVICFVTVLGQNGNYDLEVFSKASLVAIVKKSAKVAVILDYSSQLIVVHNGNRSSIIVLDISEQVRYYLQNSVWSNFDEFFEKLSSLQALLKTGQEKGEQSELGDILEEPVRQVLNEVFNSMGGSLPITKELSLLIQFIEQLRGPLIFLYRFAEPFRIVIGVDRFCEVNLALSELLSYSKGNFNNKDFNLSIKLLFLESGGAQALQAALQLVSIGFLDVNNIFEGLFISPEKVLRLLMNATGGSNNGLDGLITIMANYVGVSTGRNSINQLTESILSFNRRSDLNLDSFVKRWLTLLKNQNNRYHNFPRLSLYNSSLSAIVYKNYTYNNVPLSDIITLLPTETRRSRNPFLTLVEQLSSFYPNSTIPFFFGSIIEQFNQTLASKSTPENSNSRIFYKPSLIAIINTVAKTAVITNYTSQLCVVLNGNRSTIIVINLFKQEKYYVKSEADIPKRIWSNFEGYFNRLSNLQSFLKIGQKKGEKSQLDTLEEPARGVLVEVFNRLGGTLSVPEELLLHTNLTDQLYGPLKLVYKESGSFRIASGVDAFTKVNMAVVEELRNLKGELSPETIRPINRGFFRIKNTIRKPTVPSHEG